MMEKTMMEKTAIYMYAPSGASWENVKPQILKVFPDAQERSDGFYADIPAVPVGSPLEAAQEAALAAFDEATGGYHSFCNFDN